MQVRNLIEILPDEFGRGFLEEVAVVLVGQPEQVGHVGLRQLRAEGHLTLKQNTKQIKEIMMIKINLTKVTKSKFRTLQKITEVE